jgi:ribosomal protein S18 acetylase RimI-like enzyme
MEDRGNGAYYVGCLCVVPEYQHRGIGAAAVAFALGYYADWRKITLVTPADKEENVAFYTRKCGFQIVGSEMDGNVKVYAFERMR